MTQTELKEDYFNWLCEIVEEPPRVRRRPSYKRLLEYLHSTPFSYILNLDGNRYVDGIDLRYDFGDDFGYPQTFIATYLDNEPCSCLEMMVALAIRMEENIMANPDIGDRTSKWFWDMIASLGLDDMHDSTFRSHIVREKTQKFLNRNYEPNGAGGLFTLQHTEHDLRTVNIWYQAMWYLNEQLERGE